MFFLVQHCLQKVNRSIEGYRTREHVSWFACLSYFIIALHDGTWRMESKYYLFFEVLSTEALLHWCKFFCAFMSVTLSGVAAGLIDMVDGREITFYTRLWF